MSRIQLSQPSFANGYARSRGESAAPELWPSHAWVPSFGPTGAVLFDFGGKRYPGTFNTPLWSPAGAAFNNAGYVFVGSDILLFTNQLTVVVACDISVADQYDYVACNMGASGTGWRMWTKESSNQKWAIALKNSSNDGFDLVSEFSYIGQNQVAALRYNTDTTANFFHNGRKSTSSITVTNGLSYYYSTYTPRFYIGCGWSTVPYRFMSGAIKSFLIYDRALTDSEISTLSQNPLLPFRRRLPVFYSVPSAGGGTTYQGEAIDGISLGESTAARGIFGATAVDGIGMGEGRSGLLKALLTAADGIKLSGLSTGRLSISANGVDGIALTDAASAIAVLGALASDGITLSDTGTVGGLIGEAIDGFKIGDTSSSIASLIATAIDGATLGDSASAIASMISAAIDGIIFSDSAISGSFEGIAADGIKLTDSSLAMLRILKSVADGIAMSDTASGRVDFTVTCADGATFGETVGAIMTMLATASDTFNLGDISVYLDTHIATITLSTRSPSITFTLRKPTITFN